MYELLIGCLCQQFAFRRLPARPEVTSTFNLNLHAMIKNNIHHTGIMGNTVLFTVSGSSNSPGKLRTRLGKVTLFAGWPSYFGTCAYRVGPVLIARI